MTLPRREIIGKFTENFEYTVNGEPLSHPVWAHPQSTPISEPDILRSTQWHD